MLRNGSKSALFEESERILSRMLDDAIVGLVETLDAHGCAGWLFYCQVSAS